MKPLRSIFSFKPVMAGVLACMVSVSGVALGTEPGKPDHRATAKSKEPVEGCSQGEIGVSNPDGVTIGPELRDLVTGDPAIRIGDDSSKITIVEFTDFECPFCADYAVQIRPHIIANYVQTGKVTYIIRDSPLSNHGAAYWAHQAARCAGEQDAYGEMNEMLFLNQKVWTAGNSVRHFSVFADSIGIAAAEFETCVKKQHNIHAINADIGLAAKVGAETGGISLPMVIIDGHVVYGVRRLDRYVELIEDALKRCRR